MLGRMAVEIRTVPDDDLDAYRSCVFTTFGDDIEADPGGEVRMRALIPPERRWAAYDGRYVVATAATFDHAIGMPGGGTLPMAGLTMVTVRPTHRRRGILRQLMARHLDDAKQRGFAISGLWASEAGIYGRFGYGLAAHADAVTIENAQSIAFHPRTSGHDEIEWIDEAAARELLPDIYARATAGRPGALRRGEVWWRERRFLESPFKRGNASKRRHVLARRDGAIVGYLVFRQKGVFEATRANGHVTIVELVGIDPRAQLTLWEMALQMDLFPNVSWSNAPVDDPLAWAVVDPRRVHRRRTDTLWLRIEDVPAALAARAYSADGVLRFASAGATWELVVEDGRGRCTVSTKSPELHLADTTLASLLLGGVSPTQLALAGRVHGEPGVLARADRMFASPIAPWCPEVF
jgi:predicted acetyltransferase